MIYQDFNSHVPYNFIPVFYENFDFVEHLHGDPELITVFRGTIVVMIDEQTVVLREGDFALILPHQIHSYRSEGETRVWVCVFSEDYVRDFAAEMKNKFAKNPVFRCDDLTRAFVGKYMIDADSPSREELCSCLSILCALFRRGNEFAPRPRSGRAHLRDILNFVSEHYTEEISLSLLAKELHLDMNYLSRCFHRCIDLNFNEFVNRYRVSRAQTALSGNASMSEISEECGFRSIRTFNRVFKALTGLTPSEYRAALTR